MLTMSKERLEEIKQQVKYLQGDLMRDDLGWLIEQAERVQELEGVLKIYRKRYSRLCYESDSEIIKLEQQNKRYREALEEIKGATSHNKYWKYIAHQALESDEG